MSVQRIEELIKISKTKLNYLNIILEATERQSKSIKSNEMNKLEQCIKEKQNAMDTIDKLDTLFATKFEALKKELGIQDMAQIDPAVCPQIRGLKEVIGHIQKLLKEIASLERENHDKLQVQFNEVKSKLKQVKKGKKVMKGYGSYKQMGGSAFIDYKK